ncbi:carbohydrate ABC transporter permease [Caldicellulosiruptoraceae bacterium PP1]
MDSERKRYGSFYETLQEMKKNKSLYYMMAPFMILFLFFTVIPVIAGMYLSFTYYNIIQPPKFIGWSNYIRLFLDDDVFLIAVKNTFKFALITGPLSYFACLIFAWLINELKPRTRALATLLFYAPSLSGSVYFIWQYIFSPDMYGLMNGFLMRLGIIKEPNLWLSDPNLNLTVIMIIQLWMSLGTSFLTFIAGLQNVDIALKESGAIDGIRNRWQELWYIILPSIKPQLILGAVLQVVNSFAVSDICAQLAGFPSPLYSAHTIVLHMVDYGSIRYEMGYASAIAVILFFTTIIINQIIRKLIKPE